MKKTKIYKFRLSEEDYKKFQEWLKKNGLKGSKVLRDFINELDKSA